MSFYLDITSIIINGVISEDESVTSLENVLLSVICHAHLWVSLIVARVSDHLIPYKMIELKSADPRVMLVTGAVG